MGNDAGTRSIPELVGLLQCRAPKMKWTVLVKVWDFEFRVTIEISQYYGHKFLVNL